MKVYDTEKAVRAMLNRRGWQDFPHRIERYSGDRQYPSGGYIPVMLCEESEDLKFFREQSIKTEWVK